MPESTTTAEGQVTTADPTQQGNGGAQTTGADPKTTTGVTSGAEQAEEVQIAGLEKTDDGFKYVVNADDPNSTYYTGKTVEEVFQNMRKGIAEKDRLIKESRSRSRISETIEGEISTELPDPPDRGQITNEVCKERNLDPRFLSMTEAQWIQWQDDNKLKDWQVSDARAVVKEVRADINARYNDGNVDFINQSTALSESDAVAELITDAGIDVERFDYDSVLQKVKSDRNNYAKGGTLKSGAIVKEAAKEIRRLSTVSTKEKITADLERKIVEGKREKEQVRSAASAGVSTPGTITFEKDAPKSSELAVQEILKEIAVKNRQK